MAGTSKSDLAAALKKIAMRHPGVEVDVACKGTPLESAVYKAGKKSFLFVGTRQARLKLDPSAAAEAKQLNKKAPGSCEIGAIGWAAVTLGPDAPPLKTFAKWIGESYRLTAGGKAPLAAAKKAAATGAKEPPAPGARKASRKTSKKQAQE
jgi:predicted DNA-binding protein (MmcQ/YjbR family)